MKTEARCPLLATLGIIPARLPVERHRRPGAHEGPCGIRERRSRRLFARPIPVLEGFARAHYHVGPFGAGSKMKFVANLLVAIHNVAAAEATRPGDEGGARSRDGR